MRYIFLCLTALLFTVPVVSQAQDKSSANGESAKASKTPVERLTNATDDLLEGLSDKQLKQYRAIRSAHGLIHSIENVRRTIARAVEACSDNNPDMADELEKRFVKWKRKIRPHLSSAKDKRDNMVVLQSFAEPKQVRQHLELFDSAVAYKQERFEKQPVSDAESCRDMMDEMQSTQERLIKLLQERLALYDQLQGKTGSSD